MRDVHAADMLVDVSVPQPAQQLLRARHARALHSRWAGALLGYHGCILTGMQQQRQHGASNNATALAITGTSKPPAPHSTISASGLTREPPTWLGERSISRSTVSSSRANLSGSCSASARGRDGLHRCQAILATRIRLNQSSAGRLQRLQNAPQPTEARAQSAPAIPTSPAALASAS